MKTLNDILFRGIRYGYRVLKGKTFPRPICECDRQIANDILYESLSADTPCMVARFGTTELNCINNYLCVHSPKPYYKKCIDFIIDDTHTPWWNREHFHTMSVCSGIFPETRQTAVRFSERYLDDIPLIDVLASFQYYEKFMPLRRGVLKIQLEMLLPFFVERPWTRLLKGKRVLVIHPFEETIKQQYAKRELLFDNTEILPDFELITLKAVQTIAGNKSGYKDWFEALQYMENCVDDIDYDIALIGCGAYGLPLAAHIKRNGGKAVHMGGVLQLLFGILGNRWVKEYPEISPWHYLPGIDINIDYTSIFNENWCYPLTADTPNNAQLVEGACYWK